MSNKAFEQTRSIMSEAYNQKFTTWKDEVFFSWPWWINVILCLLLIFVWLLLRKRESTQRLLYVGLIVSALSIFLDTTGNFFGLWDYQYEVLPSSPWNFPWDLFFMPIFVMLLIQYKPRIHFLIKSIFFASISAFIGLPLLEHFNYYVKLNWSYFYSFPILIGIYLVGHFVASRTTRYNKIA